MRLRAHAQIDQGADARLLPLQGRFKTLERQTEAGHGVAHEHPSQRDGILRIEGVLPRDAGHEKYGGKQAAAGKAAGDTAGKAPVELRVASQYGTDGEAGHKGQVGGREQRMRVGKQPGQHKTGQDELEGHAQAGHEQQARLCDAADLHNAADHEQQDVGQQKGQYLGDQSGFHVIFRGYWTKGAGRLRQVPAGCRQSGRPVPDHG